MVSTFIKELTERITTDPDAARDYINEHVRLTRLAQMGLRKKKTVFFLDVDEVLQTKRAHMLGLTICPIAVNFINRLAMEYGAHIVLNSTWGSGIKSNLRAKELLEGFGFSPLVCNHPDDRDGLCGYKVNVSGMNREEKIKQWMSVYDDYDKMVIIDDSWVEYTELREYNVAPDPVEGFSVRDYFRVRYILDDVKHKNEYILPFRAQGMARDMKTWLEGLNDAK